MTGFTFSEEIWLNLIDKIAIGSVLGFGAMVGARLIERYKAGQTIRTAIAQKRVEMIAPMWEAIGFLEMELVAISSDLSRISGEVFETHKKENYPKLSYQEWLDLIAREQRAAAEPTVHPKLDAASVSLTTLDHRVDALHFWAGRPLQARHKQHTAGLRRLITALSEATSRDAYTHGPPIAVSFSLLESRLDVRDLMRHL
jgi:hypothetical protein